MNALAADGHAHAVEAAPAAPTFKEAAKLWAKIGLLTFGGPAGQIALMHKELVEERRWIGEQRFLHALNYCMLLPGPEAQQLAIYIGWLLHRTAWRPRCRHLCSCCPAPSSCWASAPSTCSTTMRR